MNARLQSGEGHNVGVGEIGPVPRGALRRHVVVVQTTARRVAQFPPLARRHGLSEMHEDKYSMNLRSETLHRFSRFSELSIISMSMAVMYRNRTLILFSEQ